MFQGPQGTGIVLPTACTLPGATESKVDTHRSDMANVKMCNVHRSRAVTQLTVQLEDLQYGAVPPPCLQIHQIRHVVFQDPRPLVLQRDRRHAACGRGGAALGGLVRRANAADLSICEGGVRVQRECDVGSGPGVATLSGAERALPWAGL